MRDYGIVSPKFWIGETGKLFRGDPQAQVVALYLMTSPHAIMTGVYYCPLDYICKETGSPSKGASKALRRGLEVGFCEYDTEKETVFVIRMAHYQIAPSLKPKDNRVPGLKRELEKMTSPLLRQRFLEVYGRAYHLVSDDWKPEPLRRGLQGASKPLRSQDQDQDQDQDQEQDLEPARKSSASSARGIRLPDDWKPTDDLILDMAKECPAVDQGRELAKFVDYWRAKPGSAGKKLDWPATYRNWIRKADEQPGRPNGKPSNAAAWAEARNRAAAIGFREPFQQESPQVYMTAIKQAETTPAAKSVSGRVSSLVDHMQRFAK